MLVQRLRRWPTLNQHLVSVPCYCQYARGQLFPDTHGNKAFCVTTQSPHERNGELIPHRFRSSI